MSLAITEVVSCLCLNVSFMVVELNLNVVGNAVPVGRDGAFLIPASAAGSPSRSAMP